MFLWIIFFFNFPCVVLVQRTLSDLAHLPLPDYVYPLLQHALYTLQDASSRQMDASDGCFPLSKAFLFSRLPRTCFRPLTITHADARFPGRLFGKVLHLKGNRDSLHSLAFFCIYPFVSKGLCFTPIELFCCSTKNNIIIQAQNISNHPQHGSSLDLRHKRLGMS